VVLMRRDPSTSEWRTSIRQYISAEESRVGLQEPDVAFLRNGTLLVVARGCNTETTPGYKWRID